MVTGQALLLLYTYITFDIGTLPFTLTSPSNFSHRSTQTSMSKGW